jgi:hypothetical protein
MQTPERLAESLAETAVCCCSKTSTSSTAYQYIPGIMFALRCQKAACSLHLTDRDLGCPLVSMAGSTSASMRSLPCRAAESACNVHLCCWLHRVARLRGNMLLFLPSAKLSAVAPSVALRNERLHNIMVCSEDISSVAAPWRCYLTTLP